MSRIPHAARRHGRYVFRRRVHFRNLISTPLSLALGTADPKVTRTRAAMLSARFMKAKATVDTMLEDGRTLTGAEIEALFRAELEAELRFYVQSAYEDAGWSSSVPEVAAQEAEAYKIFRRPDRHLGLTDSDRAELIERGLAADIAPIDDYARQVRQVLTDQIVTRRLQAVGAPVTASTIAAARTHLIRAMANACSRVQRVFDDVMDAANPVAALMADLDSASEAAHKLIAAGDTSKRPAASDGAASPVAAESQFMVFDPRSFSAVISDVLAELKAERSGAAILSSSAASWRHLPELPATSPWASIPTSMRRRSRRASSRSLRASTMAR